MGRGERNINLVDCRSKSKREDEKHLSIYLLNQLLISCYDESAEKRGYERGFHTTRGEERRKLNSFSPRKAGRGGEGEEEKNKQKTASNPSGFTRT